MPRYYHYPPAREPMHLTFFCYPNPPDEPSAEELKRAIESFRNLGKWARYHIWAQQHQADHDISP